MPTPIEIMVDAACGIVRDIKPDDLKEQSDTLLGLADAAVAWYREDCIGNLVGLEEAISRWIDIGGENEKTKG